MSTKYQKKSSVFHIINTMRLKKSASPNGQKISRVPLSKLVSKYLAMTSLQRHSELIQKGDIPKSIFISEDGRFALEEGSRGEGEYGAPLCQINGKRLYMGGFRHGR